MHIIHVDIPPIFKGGLQIGQSLSTALYGSEDVTNELRDT